MLEIERRSVKFWRIPGTTETIRYRFFMRHPLLRVGTERPLLPEKWHRLILYRTEAKLRSWADRKIPEMLAKDITDGETKYYNEAQDTSQGSILPGQEGGSMWFGDQFNASIDGSFYSGDWF